MKQEVFSFKLYELEQEYDKMRSRLKSFQSGSHEDIRLHRRQLMEECRENDILLESRVRSGRSPAVTALSEAQLAYRTRSKQILEQELPVYMHSDNGDKHEEQAEAAALYAEYAIDFAVQATRQALLAALSAMDLQLTCEERNENYE